MDNARVNTIANQLDRLALEDFGAVLLLLENRLAKAAPDASNYCARARHVCEVELAGVAWRYDEPRSAERA